MKTLLKTLSIAMLLSGSIFGQIRVGKGIVISILGVPGEEKDRINGNYVVADSGNINMPFIGQVRAAGLKPETLAATLEARYRSAQIYRQPTFQVVADAEARDVNEAMVVLGGQVGRPGPVKHLRGLTLWQAIQTAGGPTPFGTIKRVTVTRDGKQRQYDLTEVQNMNIPLEPNDAIELPQKRPWETR